MKIFRCTKLWAFTWLLILPAIVGSGQSNFIGKRKIVNYSKQEYGAGTQNWAIKQDKQERLYFANNEGLLVYNSTNWQVYPIPNNTILRSIEFGGDGKLYAGAQDEFGYFAPDVTGRLKYSSLKSLLPLNEQQFSDVWDVVSFEKEIFFRTTYKIFRLNENKIIIHPPVSTWLSLRKHQNRLIGHDEKAGLLTYANGKWETLIDKSNLPADFFITAIIPFRNDTSLIATPKNGLYLLYENKLMPYLLKGASFGINQDFTSLTKVDNEHFLAGTYANGFFLVNYDRRIIENISTQNGLQNNTIRFLFTDKAQNVWMGLDNGISFIAYNNAVKQINPPAFNNGGGYSVVSYGNKLYFALSTGLYHLPYSNYHDLSQLPDQLQQLAGGQTWNLSIVNNNLFAGRDDGFWQLTDNGSKIISTVTGYWIFQALPDTVRKIIAAGNYYGVRLFENKNNAITDIGPVKNFDESARYLVTDDKNIWVSHPYRGVYKINLTDYKVILYTDKQGLPSSLNNHVFKIKNKVVVATTEGVYEYNEAADKMELSKTYATVFGKRSLRYLSEDKDGNIWFIQDKTPGVADYSSKEPLVYYIPELKNRILSGFENIYAFDKQNIFIGGEQGFYHINYEKFKQNSRAIRCYISSVKIFSSKDSIIYGGYTEDTTKEKEATPIAVSYKWNSVQFSYYSSLYGQQQNTEYSYFLEGFDKNWSEWSKKTEKDYTNLPAGDYTFRLKARNNLGSESEESIYSFEVIPPWYKTTWAYILYVVLLLLVVYYILKYQEKKHIQKQEQRRIADRKKYEEEQQQIAYQHQLELEKSEKELIRLKNEKLETDIEFKNAELASAAMNLVQKKEFILKLRAELQHLHKAGKENNESPELKKILRFLADEEKLNEEWEQFSRHFDTVHGDFLTTLKNKYPDLKPHELKLCAYLRMNLSSKEIAQLMSISVRGVEISRYRLRKKLQISTETNLVQFLFELKGVRKNITE